MTALDDLFSLSGLGLFLLAIFCRSERLEISWILVWTVFGFVDAAKLWNQDAFGYDSRPWSVGAGVRARTRRGQVSLVYAAPQNAPFPGAVRPKDRLLLSLSTTFSFR